MAGERKALQAYAKARLCRQAQRCLCARRACDAAVFLHARHEPLARPLDVHDVGTGSTRDPYGKKRKLEPGMVFTVEPGLYFDKDDTRVAAEFRGIGVRIEDDGHHCRWS